MTQWLVGGQAKDVAGREKHGELGVESPRVG